MSSYLLLTGATGLLGGYILRNALTSGGRIAVVARRTAGIPARARVDALLQHWERRLQRTLPRPVVLDGDLNRPDLALPASDRAWIKAHCDAALHCAASLTFLADQPGEPYRTNVEGTRQLLALCESTGIRRLHHVSTAYVCGDRQGTIREADVDVGQSFNNDYEASKLQAETLVRNSSFLESLTVYRPSIIVGDSETGYTSSFFGIYIPLQLIHRGIQAGRCSADQAEPFYRLWGLEGRELKNLVPVDWVADVIAEIVGRPELHGATYHLTNPRPVMISDLERAWRSALASAPGKVATTAENRQGFAAEAFSGESELDSLRGYLRSDPEFDVENLQRAVPHVSCPQLDHTRLTKLSEYALGTDFGWPPDRPLHVRLNVEELLRNLLNAELPVRDSRTLRLEVSGSGGGAWTLAFNSNVPVAARRGTSTCGDGVYLTSNTLESLIRQEVTVAGAVAAGKLVLEGDRAEFDRTVQMVSALCSGLSNRV